MSSIPAVMAALATLAKATVSDDWLVINGPVGSVTTTKGNHVLIGDGDVVGTEEFNALGGWASTDERYLVPITVSAFVPGTAQAVADALALDVSASIKQAIGGHPAGPGLGLPGVLTAAPTGSFTLKRIADGDARYAALQFAVDVWAQNT